MFTFDDRRGEGVQKSPKHAYVIHTWMFPYHNLFLFVLCPVDLKYIKTFSQECSVEDRAATGGKAAKACSLAGF